MPHRGVTHTQHAKTIDCDPSVDILSVRKTREYILPLCKDMRSSVQTFLQIKDFEIFLPKNCSAKFFVNRNTFIKFSEVRLSSTWRIYEKEKKSREKKLDVYLSCIVKWFGLFCKFSLLQLFGTVYNFSCISNSFILLQTL